MLHKTRGIVLKVTSYSESSIVTQIFTQKFGVQSYLINGVKKQKSKIKLNILQPLHLLDLVVYHKPNSQLQRIAEVKISPQFKTIPYHITKNIIVQFLNEVLYKCLKTELVDNNLFEYIFNSLIWLDEVDEVDNNFHLIFLMKLSQFLGFAPRNNEDIHQKYFDLQEGLFTSSLPLHPYYIDLADGKQLLSLFEVNFFEGIKLNIVNKQRRFLLDKILIYYKLHTASFSEVKSHLILEELLSD